MENKKVTLIKENVDCYASIAKLGQISSMICTYLI